MFKQIGRVDSGEVKGVKHPVPPRNEGRVLLEVTVTPQNGTTVAGQHWPQGTSRRVVYESQMEEVLSRVASPEEAEAWDRAVKVHQAMLDEHVRRELRPTPEKEADPSFQILKARTVKTFAGSPSAEFCKLFATGKRPLAKVEVIDRAAPPETPENQQKNLVMQIAQAMGGGGEVAELRRENAELRASLEALASKLDKIAKKG